MLFRKVLFVLSLGLALTLTKAQSLRGNGKRILYRRSGHRQGCLTLNSNGTCEGNVTPVDLHDGEGPKCWVGGVARSVCGGGHHGGPHGGNHVEQQYANVGREYANVGINAGNVGRQYANVGINAAYEGQQYANMGQQYANMGQQYANMGRHYHQEYGY